MKHKIYNWSFGYQIGRLYVSLAQKVFYNKIIVKGIQNIPKDKPVIFAPNHQNAIMDAMAVACNIPNQVVFMARADVFQNKFIARILRFIKIMPIYRIRDGYENLAKNENAFSYAIEVLQNNKSLCLMPEGTHGDKHQLQPLIKGIFRIALMALDKNPNNPPVIIPVGIDYSSYYSFRSQLIVQFGEPIVIEEYYNLYKTNPALALNSLRTYLSEEMKKLMINVECGEFYDEVDSLRYLLRPLVLKYFNLKKQNTWNRFLADKWFVEKCNFVFKINSEFFHNTLKEIKEIKIELKNFNIPTEVFLSNRKSSFHIIKLTFLLIIFTPIFLIGYTSHIALIRLPRLFNKHFDDRQFHSSVKFATITFLFPVYYFVIGIFIWKFIPHWYFQLAGFAFIMFSGEFSYHYYKIFQQFNWSIRMNFHKKDIESAKAKVLNLWTEFITTQL